jgi:hypothetical protein
LEFVDNPAGKLHDHGVRVNLAAVSGKNLPGLFTSHKNANFRQDFQRSLMNLVDLPDIKKI